MLVNRVHFLCDICFPTADLSERCVARMKTHAIPRFEFILLWWKRDHSSDAYTFHRNALSRPKKKSARSFDLNGLSVSAGTIIGTFTDHKYGTFLFSRNSWRWYDIPVQRIQPIKILLYDESLISKAESIKKFRISRGMNEERIRYRETIARNRDEDVSFQWRSSSDTKIHGTFSPLNQSRSSTKRYATRITRQKNHLELFSMFVIEKPDFPTPLETRRRRESTNGETLVAPNCESEANQYKRSESLTGFQR